jgi:hypothetical protein
MAIPRQFGYRYYFCVFIVAVVFLLQPQSTTTAMTLPNSGIWSVTSTRQHPAPFDFDGLRGGDIILKSRRSFGSVRGVYTAGVSALILAFPMPMVQVLRFTAAVILVSSILELTIHKGFL